MAEKVMENGAISSDYAPGTPPEVTNFPPWNCMISGLSLVTVVVEASLKSGGLITADFALEQNWEVFTVSGSVIALPSRGPNKLFQNGAYPLLDPQEIEDVLDLTRVTEQLEARVT